MLTLKSIAAIEPGMTAWNRGRSSVSGFEARRQKSEPVSYVLKYQTADGDGRPSSLSEWRPMFHHTSFATRLEASQATSVTRI
jgi:hypothetical protein